MSTTPSYLRPLLSDIRFWILLLLVLRLYGITLPPLEVGHNWRQTTVTMVARNFFEIDANPFYPRIDIAGNLTGITGMEFPLLNYLIYLVAEVLGYEHWYGRLINLVVSSFGLWYFYILLRKYFSERASFYSTLILAVSIWFQFSRKIMPDTFSVSLIIAALYYGTQFLEQSRSKLGHLFLYFLLSLLGLLSKLPSGTLLVVLAIPMLDVRILFYKKILFVVTSILALEVVYFWYFMWVPYLVYYYDFWHFFMGKGIGTGLQEILAYWQQTARRFYETALKYIGFGVFVYGLAQSLRTKNRLLMAVFVLCLMAFSVIMLKAGFTFAHHDYYIIPFVPVMALIAGYALSNIKNPTWVILLLIAISAENIINQLPDFRIKDSEMALMHLESDLDKVTKPHELVMINSTKYPTPMYFAHRKGWIGRNDTLIDARYIHQLKKVGLKYIVILKKTFGNDTTLGVYKQVFDNQDYRIYSVKTEY